MFSGPNHVEKVSAAFGAAVCGKMADFSPQKPDLGAFGHYRPSLAPELT